MTNIFGYTWEQIQSAQQGGRLHKTVDSSVSGRSPATDKDRELLAEYGYDGLLKMGFHGVIDRLQHKG